MTLYDVYSVHCNTIECGCANFRNRVINLMHNKFLLMLTNASRLLINTFVSALPSVSTPITIDVTGILGGALFPFATSLLLPVSMGVGGVGGVWVCICTRMHVKKKCEEEGVVVSLIIRQIIVWSLVKDKEERHLIMMEQNGMLALQVLVIPPVSCLSLFSGKIVHTNCL